jgi:hypothetical protein
MFETKKEKLAQYGKRIFQFNWNWGWNCKRGNQ